MRSARDIYIAIMVASSKGVGLRLTADEVGELAGDEAIYRAALNGLDEIDWPDAGRSEPNWSKIDPSRKRIAANLSATAPEDRKR